MSPETLPGHAGLAAGARRVVVVGCGDVGSALARALSEAGHRVRVMDIRRDALDSLPEGPVGEGSITPLLGDGTSEADLLAASIREADLLIAATGSDADNALAAQMALHVFEVRSALCRYDEPSGRALYGELGLTAVSATELAAQAIMDSVRGA